LSYNAFGGASLRRGVGIGGLTLECYEHAAQLGDEAPGPWPVERPSAVGQWKTQPRHAADPHGARRMKEQSYVVDDMLCGQNACSVNRYARRPRCSAGMGVPHTRSQRPCELLTFVYRRQPHSMHGERASDRCWDTGRCFVATCIPRRND